MLTALGASLRRAFPLARASPPLSQLSGRTGGPESFADRERAEFKFPRGSDWVKKAHGLDELPNWKTSRWSNDTKPPLVVRHLAMYGEAALRPHRKPWKQGAWFKPLISNRRAKVHRKAAIRAGTFGSFSLECGATLSPALHLFLFMSTSPCLLT